MVVKNHHVSIGLVRVQSMRNQYVPCWMVFWCYFFSRGTHCCCGWSTSSNLLRQPFLNWNAQKRKKKKINYFFSISLNGWNITSNGHSFGSQMNVNLCTTTCVSDGNRSYGRWKIFNGKLSHFHLIRDHTKWKTINWFFNDLLSKWWCGASKWFSIAYGTSSTRVNTTIFLHPNLPYSYRMHCISRRSLQ